MPCWPYFQLPHWHRSSKSCTQRHVPLWISCYHVTPALWQLHWLPVAERIQYKLCLLVHKSLLGHTPEYILDLLTSVANIPGQSTLCASSCGNLVVPWTRPRIGDRAFSVAAPRAWNRHRLPMELKLLRSTDLFRRDLKTFLFPSVYGHQDADWLYDAPSVF